MSEAIRFVRVRSILDLRRGDIIRNVGNPEKSLVVDKVTGDRATAVRTQDVTNPDEWEVMVPVLSRFVSVPEAYEGHAADRELLDRLEFEEEAHCMSGPDARIAGINAPFIATLRTGRGTEIVAGRNFVRRIRQVVNDQGLLLNHVVESMNGGETLVYDGVEADLVQERAAFKPAKREKL